MYAKIGDIVLSGALGMEEANSETSTNLVEIDLIQGKPVIQPIAFNLNTLKLSVVLHSAFCNPEKIISQLKNYVDNVTPVNITLGTGEDIGNFLLKSLKTEAIQNTPISQIIQSRIELDLLEYTGVMPTPAPPAMLSANPILVIPAGIPVTLPPSADIVKNVTAASAASADLNNNISKALVSNPGTVTQQKAITKSLLRVQNINDSLSKAYTSASNATQLANQAINLRARIVQAQTALASLKSFLKIKDINSANLANQNFQSSMFQVGNLASPFTQQYFFRRTI